MKRWTGMLFILILSLAVTVACSSGGTKSSDQPAPASDKKTNPPATSAKPTQKDWGSVTAIYKSHPSAPFKDNWLIWDIYREKAGVQIKPSAYPGQFWEAWELTLASGNLPDMMYVEPSRRANKAGQDGFLLDLNKYMDKMPNFKKWLDKNPDYYKLLVDSEGALYMTPNPGAYSQLDSSFFYREDIFKKHNLKTPTNYTEFLDVMRELKKLYPDSYPFVFDGWAPGLLSASFNTSREWIYDTKKKDWVYGPATDEYKELVTFIATAYKEKLIAPDFLTMKSEQRNELIYNNKAFIQSAYLDNLDGWLAVGRKTDPNYTWSSMIPPAGSNGGAFNSYAAMYEMGMTVTADAKNKEGAFHLIDWHFTEEGKEAVSWGKEGVTYSIVDGKKKMNGITNALELTNKYGIRANGTELWFDSDVVNSLMSPDTRKAFDVAVKYLAPPQVAPKFNAAENEKMSLIQTAIGKYAEENVSKFMIGKRPMSEWNDYVDGLNKLGMKDIHDIHVTASNRAKK
ncbi:type 2 periplasmic-binding domain-containing protein [Paenibacillus cymbidii]|uniref:extracellular solute-binding protein n=1 Tax=Paenibacillus cymbidii TaxID=1639034 RepID=UPI001081BC25|nr:extracellular solute-binding protein [Paenibacillus cymbidii]